MKNLPSGHFDLTKIETERDIDKTLETKEHPSGHNTYYLDRWTDGTFTVCRDEFLVKRFNNEEEARTFWSTIGE